MPAGNLRLVPTGNREPEPSRPDLTSLALASRGNPRDELTETRLWEGARDLLTRLAVAFGTPASDVPDLVQETMWAAYRALDEFDPERGSFEAWCGTILVRRARNRHRGRTRRQRLLDCFGIFRRTAASASAGSSMEATEARITLEALLAALSERQRRVIALYEIAGLSAREVSRILEIEESSVRSLARQARMRLTQAADRCDRRQRKTRTRDEKGNHDER